MHTLMTAVDLSVALVAPLYCPDAAEEAPVDAEHWSAIALRAFCATIHEALDREMLIRFASVVRNF